MSIPRAGPIRVLALLSCTIAFGFLPALSSQALATRLRFDDIRVPATYPQVKDSPTWSLEAVVVRADDHQRHPLAVFIDGTPETSPRPMLYVARELARRGWTTVAVMRPGYSSSEGKEAPALCGNYVAQANFASQTLRETIRAMSHKPYIDPSQTIVIGHSTGGVGAVATTVNPPDSLVAAISFAGSNGSQYLKGKLDTVCASDDLIKTFATFGRHSSVPMLWIYTQSDHHMGPFLPQAYYKAFTGAGGTVDFEIAPSTGKDGHQLYARPEGVAIWAPYLDNFLSARHLALVSSPLHVTVPDLAPPAALGQSGRAGFANYLAAMPHKAFVMSNSHWGSAWLFNSTKDAVKRAMSHCKSTVGDPCRTVMVDDQPIQ